MDNILYYLLALLPLLFLITISKASLGARRHRHGLHLPPGPWRLPGIGSLHHLRGELPHRALRDLSLRYGPLMFLKFGEIPVVVASTPDAAKEILKTRDAVFSTRPLSLTMKVITKNGAGVVWAPYGEHWRQLRKICMMELLSAKRVQSFRHIREEEAARLAMAVSAATTPLVNLSKLLAIYVADASVHAILGSRFKDRDTLLRYVDEAVKLAGGSTLVDLFPSSRIARALSRRALRKAEVYRETVFAFMDGVVREHLERRSLREEARQEDLIDVLLRIRGEGNLQFPLTMHIIEAVIFDLFGGGTETAATTLQWAMAELMRNPAVMCKAQAEVRRVFKEQNKITEERLRELSYLHLVIKETLRLHTPGPLLMPRECQEQCQILGYDVPKGTMVLVNAWAISRNPEFWDAPDEFNPERFQGDMRDFKGNDFDYIPFGAGRRICPGMAFGLANMELALANLLFYFDWSLPEGVIPSEMDMTEAMGVTARRKADLLLSATLRVPLPN
ncbi:hypothetical protein PAHAL_4G242800 [Panicum hallii]|uniref:Uncharacterized protein n=1 Tax=Panicum hallii TaxID=206008 RepID=A0A2S3HJU5_9POAL|nr:premnaspirodiene oxygenase-like isoform X1 [Panicum hallii]PAN24661.1 hypothetical protein PAHAL_4G242800 [Panicum hallii]